MFVSSLWVRSTSMYVAPLGAYRYVARPSGFGTHVSGSPMLNPAVVPSWDAGIVSVVHPAGRADVGSLSARTGPGALWLLSVFLAVPVPVCCAPGVCLFSKTTATIAAAATTRAVTATVAIRFARLGRRVPASFVPPYVV